MIRYNAKSVNNQIYYALRLLYYLTEKNNDLPNISSGCVETIDKI